MGKKTKRKVQKAVDLYKKAQLLHTERVLDDYNKLAHAFEDLKNQRTNEFPIGFFVGMVFTILMGIIACALYFGYTL